MNIRIISHDCVVPVHELVTVFDALFQFVQKVSVTFYKYESVCVRGGVLRCAGSCLVCRCVLASYINMYFTNAHCRLLLLL